MIDDYLGRLGLPRAAPSVDYLFDLHRAHVSRVTYTNLQIMRGQPAPIEPEASVREIVAGRNGYCFHLNGAFSWLLRSLGFSVSLHRGYVSGYGVEQRVLLNHLVLVVHDLGGMWFVDAGLGDALYEPLPLIEGSYKQGPFRYELKSLASGDGWRFEHDESGSFGAMEFEAAPARVEDFAKAHERLSTSPESSFRRFVVAQVRLADSVQTVRGCTLTIVDGSGKQQSYLDDPLEWSNTLTRLGLNPAGLAELWPSERATHEAWLAGND